MTSPGSIQIGGKFLVMTGGGGGEKPYVVGIGDVNELEWEMAVWVGLDEDGRSDEIEGEEDGLVVGVSVDGRLGVYTKS